MPTMPKAEKAGCQPFPKAASEDLLGGVARNFQVFEPLDFLAELTQHIPNPGEHHKNMCVNQRRVLAY